ncbi:MAG: N-acetyltransferase [Proteobacteria bacterium]|nr:N-acetyltransferase [Pseudomonadota bacterium]
MSSLEIIPVSGGRDFRDFVRFPFQLFQNDPHWVPPLLLELKIRLNPKRNPFFEHAEVQLFLARAGKKILGRVAAIVDHRHEQFHRDGAGLFGFFESVNDPAVAGALLEKAGIWLFRRGKKTIRGPVNPSLNDEAGLLVDGFDSPPMVFMTYNPAYYASLLEGLGFKKIRDLYAYRLSTLAEPPEQIVKFAEEVKHSEKITIRHFNIRDVKGEGGRIMEVYNSAWLKNWGFVPLTPAELSNHTGYFQLPAVRKKVAPWILFAEVEGRPVGFSLTVPNFNEVFRRMNGRLLPFGIFHFLAGIRKIKSARVYALGVIPEYRKSGIASLFYLETLMTGKRLGFEWGEMSWILDSNEQMNRAIRLMGGEVYKTYRIYEKALPGGF